ncbi:hypothetical protein NE237_014540 [Protea cynaroides]|uniref:Uncharacterized protein n=1 Tax=Protea cynaroides TaxID=273540 RepID=A0A9Q0KCE6_9MAGN|nr:hypothetical protein NE237_014540 [Protea cynaroides]
MSSQAAKWKAPSKQSLKGKEILEPAQKKARAAEDCPQPPGGPHDPRAEGRGRFSPQLFSKKTSGLVADQVQGKDLPVPKSQVFLSAGREMHECTSVLKMVVPPKLLRTGNQTVLRPVGTLQ